jgi:mono/diheme cytochrome c family protein
MHSRLSLVLVSLCLSLGLSLVACGGGGVSAADGDVAKGEAAVTARMCKDCHADNMAGSPDKLEANKLKYPDTEAYSSNLTPDKETGLGDWTDEEIDKALRQGIDDAAKPLCEPMPIYSAMADDEVANIVAYLRSLPPVKREVKESSCPSMK